MIKEYGQVVLRVDDSLNDQALTVSINYSTSGSKNIEEMTNFVNDCQEALADARFIESLIKREYQLDQIKKKIGFEWDYQIQTISWRL